MDFDKITNSIFLGAKIVPEDLVLLRDNGINVVVNMMAEDNSEQDFVEAAGLDYHYFPTEDGFPLSLSELVVGSETILKAISQSLKKVYVHCGFGVGRSPYMVAAVLMNTGMETYDAINFVSSKRMISRLSPWQEIALTNFERYIMGLEPIEQAPEEGAVEKFWKSRAKWLKSVGLSVESDYILNKVSSGVIFVR